MKILDEQGLQYLWKKISLEDYPNNETLIAVLNAIDSTKQDKTDENLLTESKELVSAINELKTLIGDDEIGQQIITALDNFTYSWNDLEDKPFGEEKNYIWSGTYADMESLETRIIDGYECVNISTSLVEYTDLSGLNYIMYENGVPTRFINTLSIDNFEFESNYIIKCANDGIYVVGQTFESNGETISSGLWIRKNEYWFVGEIYRGIFKQLDEKFIPDTIARVEDIPEPVEHTWETLPDKPFGEGTGITTVLPERSINIAALDVTRVPFENTLMAGETYSVTVDGTTYEIECSYDDTYGPQNQLIVNDDLFIYEDVDSPGYLGFMNSLTDSVTIVASIVGPGKVIIPLDEKYLPEHTHLWNEIEDRPFGEFTFENILRDNVFTYTAEEHNSNLPHSYQFTNAAFYIGNGIEYTVVFDNVSYPCTGEGFWLDGSYPHYFLGNGSLLKSSLWDNGLPFVYFHDSNQNIHYIILADDAETEHSIQVYTEVNESIPIDEYYIPETIVRDWQLEAKANKSDLDNYYLKTEADNLHSELHNYVDTEVAALVNAAPETLDTLGELAAAFEENKEVVEALDASITNKQDKISDTLILVDTVTGIQHKIQIQNGQLVSFPVE